MSEFFDTVAQAIKENDLEKVKTLIEAEKNRSLDFDLNKIIEPLSYEKKGTLLHVAAIHDKKDICQYLVEQEGMDVNLFSDPGLYAAIRPPVMCAPANICAPTNIKEESTYRFLLEKTQSPEVISKLLTNYVESTSDKREQAQKRITLLLDKASELGLDINKIIVASPYNGGTLLHLAARDQKKDIIEILLEKGADINARQYVDREGKIREWSKSL